MRRTELALLARGVDSDVARSLAEKNWTISKLSVAKKSDLRQLGLSEELIGRICGHTRPPIPNDTLTRLLFKNRFQCCICRDPERNIVVHHISPWAKSKSHDEKNLAVLCLEHHARVHSPAGLSQTLTPRIVRSQKVRWEREVREFDARSILDASQFEYCGWCYFNHLRVFELAKALGVRLTDAEAFRGALSKRLIHSDGSLRARNSKTSYMYDGADGIYLYEYVKDIMSVVLERIHVLNLSDYLDRGSVTPLVAANDFIFVQGAHTFQSDKSARRGRGQTTKGRRSANGVEVRYVFDRWEATSCSCWVDWLRGRKSVGSLIRVRGVERINGKLVISGTILGIAHGLDILKTRDYSPHLGRWIWMNDVESDDEDDDIEELL